MSQEPTSNGIFRRTLLKAGAAIAGTLGMTTSVTASSPTEETRDDEQEPSEPDPCQKAYLIVVSEITDMDRFMNEYLPVAAETADAYGGETLVFSFDPNVVEGEWDHTLTVVVEFPSLQTAREWYADETYQEVKQIRHETTAYTNLIFAPQFVPEDLS
ncbi:DUF1330 domain-containing protein [Halalkalicoccus ordinarius]|uniref:DUF1330 domain-containing protein n=1 Tax=Halalkalicoccus ordinarius TaxID=3116651 RepID=UPI00300F2483